MEQYNIRFKFMYKHITYNAEGIVYDIDESMNVNINNCIFLTYYKADETIYLGDVSKCLDENPGLSLDVVVMLTLVFIQKFIGKKTLSISDLAMKGNVSISWFNFFSSRGAKTTAYSKFGFQLTSPDEENRFDKIMLNVEKNIKHQIPGKKITYEKYLKDLILEALKKQNDMSYFSIDEKLNIMKVWYMDWDIYDAIPEKGELFDLDLF